MRVARSSSAGIDDMPPTNHRSKEQMGTATGLPEVRDPIIAGLPGGGGPSLQTCQ